MASRRARRATATGAGTPASRGEARDTRAARTRRPAGAEPPARALRTPVPRETVLSGLGDAHLEVTVSRLAARFGVEVDPALPQLPYRETIRGKAGGAGKHK